MRGNVFLHPPLRFAIEFPDGWEITNSDEQVVAQEPGNKVFMVLRTIERGARAARSIRWRSSTCASRVQADRPDVGDDRSACRRSSAPTKGTRRASAR